MWHYVYGSRLGNVEGIEEDGHALGKRKPFYYGVSVRYVVTQVVTRSFSMPELFSFRSLMST
jgi:hypothetical protein